MNSKFIKTLLSGLILTVSCGMFSPTVADEVPAKLTMEKDIKIAEGHCMLMVSLRLGDGFEPTVTDRREGMNSENIPTFTYVGTAENKDSGEELSFICKFAMENGNYNITEFKIMKVVPQADGGEMTVEKRVPMPALHPEVTGQ